MCKILDLSVNKLTTNDKYSLVNRDNLTQSIHMQLSKKQKAFSKFVVAFTKCRSNSEHFDQKHDAHTLCISDVTECERRGQRSVKSPVYEVLQEATW